MGLKELVFWIGVPVVIICFAAGDVTTLVGANIAVAAYWASLYLFLDRPAAKTGEVVKP